MTYAQKEIVFKVVTAIVAVFVLWTFSLLPVAFIAQAKCLEKGYPESRVVWNYKTYCVNLDGAVVGKVVTVKSLKDSDGTD